MRVLDRHRMSLKGTNPSRLATMRVQSCSCLRYGVMRNADLASAFFAPRRQLDTRARVQWTSGHNMAARDWGRLVGVPIEEWLGRNRRTKAHGRRALGNAMDIQNFFRHSKLGLRR